MLCLPTKNQRRQRAAKEADHETQPALPPTQNAATKYTDYRYQVRLFAIRRAMLQRDINELPLYPEERTTSRPTAEQILRLYSLTQRHLITHHNDVLHAYEPELTPIQQQVLDLLGIPESRYRPNA
jgi:hypothetical protein